MRRLGGMVALVTGGACGLGKAIAERLLADGAVVVISDIQRELGEVAASECGFHFVHHDVRSASQWGEVAGDVTQRFGKLDILVNNAGIMGSLEAADPETSSLEDWRKVFAVNLDGTFLGCQAAIRSMRRTGGGAIVNLSSMASRLATPHLTAYGASKAAVRHLTMSVAQHCAQERLNIRCNSVHPGMILTPLLKAGLAEISQMSGVSVENLLAERKAAIPLGDFTTGADIAATVAFLASEDARHVTGSEFFVDGGFVNCNLFKPKRDS